MRATHVRAAVGLCSKGCFALTLRWIVWITVRGCESIDRGHDMKEFGAEVPSIPRTKSLCAFPHVQPLLSSHSNSKGDRSGTRIRVSFSACSCPALTVSSLERIQKQNAYGKMHVCVEDFFRLRRRESELPAKPRQRARCGKCFLLPLHILLVHGHHRHHILGTEDCGTCTSIYADHLVRCAPKNLVGRINEDESLVLAS